MDTSKQMNITVEAYSPVGRSGHSGDIRHLVQERAAPATCFWTHFAHASQPGFAWGDNKIIKSVAAAHNISTYQAALLHCFWNFDVCEIVSPSSISFLQFQIFQKFREYSRVTRSQCLGTWRTLMNFESLRLRWSGSSSMATSSHFSPAQLSIRWDTCTAYFDLKTDALFHLSVLLEDVLEMLTCQRLGRSGAGW